MKTFVENSETDILIMQYCKNCGCELFKQPYDFGFTLRDGKREISVANYNDIMNAATKLNRIHKLEDVLKEERDFRVRRKIKSKLAGIVQR